MPRSGVKINRKKSMFLLVLFLQKVKVEKKMGEKLINIKKRCALLRNFF